ncbi:hypothetical protein GCM10022254_07930 [Actinomadura meridiana]|uniref:Uncharacterized protein n=1 Tax=Actinomadura meridiana TaxID=559626 RepID=A0ABP8BTJ8_9ACTN
MARARPIKRVRQQEHDAVGDLLGLAEPAERQFGHALAADLALHDRPAHVGVGDAGRDAVGVDAALPELAGDRLGERDQPGLAEGGQVVPLRELVARSQAR